LARGVGLGWARTAAGCEKRALGAAERAWVPFRMLGAFWRSGEIRRRGYAG
jgi:hypothetical protein